MSSIRSKQPSAKIARHVMVEQCAIGMAQTQISVRARCETQDAAVHPGDTLLSTLEARLTSGTPSRPQQSNMLTHIRTEKRISTAALAGVFDQAEPRCHRRAYCASRPAPRRGRRPQRFCRARRDGGIATAFDRERGRRSGIGSPRRSIRSSRRPSLKGAGGAVGPARPVLAENPCAQGNRPRRSPRQPPLASSPILPPRRRMRRLPRSTVSARGPPTFICCPASACRCMPAGDLALQEAARIAFGLRARPTAKEMVPLAEPWRPFRAVAARVLWTYYRTVKGREGAPSSPDSPERTTKRITPKKRGANGRSNPRELDGPRLAPRPARRGSLWCSCTATAPTATT